MSRKFLIPHLLLNLLHCRRLHLNRPIRMPPRYLQEPARNNMKHVAVSVRFANLAALAVGFHVRRQCGGGFEDAEAFQAAVVGALVEAGGQMHF